MLSKRFCLFLDALSIVPPRQYDANEQFWFLCSENCGWSWMHGTNGRALSIIEYHGLFGAVGVATPV